MKSGGSEVPDFGSRLGMVRWPGFAVVGRRGLDTSVEAWNVVFSWFLWMPQGRSCASEGALVGGTVAGCMEFSGEACKFASNSYQGVVVEALDAVFDRVELGW